MTTHQTQTATLEAVPAQGLDRLLEPGSPELAALLETIADGASERERDQTPPHEQIDLIRSSRLGALRLPRDNGGAGASVRDLYRVLVALAAADANVAHILRSHFCLVEQILRLPDVDPRWRQEVAAGSIFAGAATELGPGALGGIAPGTTLTREGDSYRLDGTKYYSTGSLYSDWLMLTATDEAGELAIALVPANRDGVVLEDDWDGMGQRLTGSGTTRLSSVFVNADELLDPEAIAASAPRFAMPQLYLTAVVAGVIRDAAGDAAALVRSREGRPFAHAAARPAEDPLLQEVVGEIASAAFAAEATVLIAAEAQDVEIASIVDGVVDRALADSAALAAAQAKVVVDGLAFRAGTRLFDVGGASATKQANNLDRHWRNARTLASHNPTIHKAQAIGDLEINGTPLPDNWFF